MIEEAVKDLVYKMADDQLIIGHRNSEWTGLGPMLEEDIAFSSMAQDKVGQSYTLYQLLEQLGESDPDTVAFTRNADQFHNCQFVELPIGDYSFSLIRHFLFDTSEYIRFEKMSDSPLEELADLAKKFKGEILYHTMHARSFVKKLGTSNDQTVSRMQKALDEAFPFALGIFEESRYEEFLKSEGIWAGEAELGLEWYSRISEVLAETELKTPKWDMSTAIMGGRYGEHTTHLQPLLDEMSEVFNVDPTAEW